MPSAADCGAVPLTPLSGAVHRITDRQGQSGTADLVDGLREKARLEQLIEAVKPPMPSDGPEAAEGRPLPSHRLLLTPFRYPPLQSGSRFGGPGCSASRAPCGRDRHRTGPCAATAPQP
jgi:hypothetical protein